MNINKKQMDEINNVQLKIFKEFVSVCKKLNLRYYLVHGSLLGAVKYNGFFPYDDDIDVAMPRKDYEIFIREGQNFLSNNLFVQSSLSEKDYPLVFAKVRDSKTCFIQPLIKNLNINKGIYIDIFPIDNYPSNFLYIFFYKCIEKIYRFRIASSMFSINKNFIKKFLSRIICFILPDNDKVLKNLNSLYCNVKNTGKIIIYGGKDSERGIDSNLFSEVKKVKFEGISSSIPLYYENYLNIIYPDYMNYSPAEKYMVGDDLVKVSAIVIDVNKSYLDYEKPMEKDYEK